MTITPAQAFSARALLGWTRADLARRAGVSSSTVRSFELGSRVPEKLLIVAMRGALEAAGVEFTNSGEPGVRMKAASSAISDEAALPEIPDEAEPYDGAPV